MFRRTLPLKILRPCHTGRAVNREGEHYKWIKQSIYKDGLFDPLVVRQDVAGEYEIIDGLHRFAALEELKMKNARCHIYEMDDDQVLVAQVKLNRKSKLTEEEMSLCLKRILNRNILMKYMEMAKLLGCHGSFIKKHLGLNNLVLGVIKAVRVGKICLTNAHTLAKLPRDEQRDWKDHAQTQRPDVFVPAVNERLKMLRQAATFKDNVKAWKESLEAIADPNDFDIATLAALHKSHPENPCGEITLKSMPFEPGGIHPAHKQTFERCGTLKGDVAILKEFCNKSLGAPSPIHDEAVIYATSHELLHGPKIETVKIKYAVKMESEPLMRKGWDIVHGKGNGLAYCRGPWLVLYSGRVWTINHPEKQRVSNMNFSCPTEAMVFIEENFNE